MTESGTDSPIEHHLSPEDAVCSCNPFPLLVLLFSSLLLSGIDDYLLLQECCICLSNYDDGAELRELPCGHHFHASCVDKWLYTNATCPLCKYNIVKDKIQGSEQV